MKKILLLLFFTVYFQWEIPVSFRLYWIHQIIYYLHDLLCVKYKLSAKNIYSMSYFNFVNTVYTCQITLSSYFKNRLKIKKKKKVKSRQWLLNKYLVLKYGLITKNYSLSLPIRFLLYLSICLSLNLYLLPSYSLSLSLSFLNLCLFCVFTLSFSSHLINIVTLMLINY